MRLSSTADPLPTRFLARRIRLSAGSAKRVHSAIIRRRGNDFRGRKRFFPLSTGEAQTTGSRRNTAISALS